MSAPPAYSTAPPPSYLAQPAHPAQPVHAAPPTTPPTTPPIFTLPPSTGHDTTITTTSRTHPGYHIPASLSSPLSSLTLSCGSRHIFTIHRSGLLVGARGIRIQLDGSKVHVLSGLSKFGYRSSDNDVAMRIRGGEITDGKTAAVLAATRRYKTGEEDLEGLEVLVDEGEGRAVLVDALVAVWVCEVWMRSWEKESVGSRVRKMARKGARGEMGLRGLVGIE